MEPVCTPAALERLANRIRDEGVEVDVETDASRVRLPGGCYARPDEDRILGWTEGRNVLWYGRFRSVADLLSSARRIRRVRWAARVGVALIGLWLTHLLLARIVPDYWKLTGDMDALHAALALLAVLGLLAWLAARFVRWRMTSKSAGVVWVRSPWQRT